MGKREILRIGEGSGEMAKELAMLIQRTYIQFRSANSSKNFVIGVSGGSLPKVFADSIKSITKIDWSDVKFIFCDERLVSFDDDNSNMKAYQSVINSENGITESNFIKADISLNVEEAAKDYQRKIISLNGGNDNQVPKFNIMLLGMGPDGHTCSLFPGHALLEENTAFVVPISDSPKPPSKRITLTYSVLNNADFCIFVVTGANKAETVKQIFENPQNECLPAARVNPIQKCYWLLDNSAAGQLTSS